MVRREVLGAHQVKQHAGFEVAGSRAHHEAAGRREAHRGVAALAGANGRETRAGAEVREDHAPVGRFRARDAREFFHQVFVGDAVEAVPPDALRVVAPRDRKRLRNRRQVLVERGVEARDLRHPWAARRERREQVEFGRQVRRIERLQLLQVAE